MAAVLAGLLARQHLRDHQVASLCVRLSFAKWCALHLLRRILSRRDSAGPLLPDAKQPQEDEDASAKKGGKEEEQRGREGETHRREKALGEIQEAYAKAQGGRLAVKRMLSQSMGGSARVLPAEEEGEEAQEGEQGLCSQGVWFEALSALKNKLSSAEEQREGAEDRLAQARAALDLERRQREEALRSAHRDLETSKLAGKQSVDEAAAAIALNMTLLGQMRGLKRRLEKYEGEKKAASSSRANFV